MKADPVNWLKRPNQNTCCSLLSESNADDCRFRFQAIFSFAAFLRIWGFFPAACLDFCGHADISAAIPQSRALDATLHMCTFWVCFFVCLVFFLISLFSKGNVNWSLPA